MSKPNCYYCEKEATHKISGIALCDSEECFEKFRKTRQQAFQFLASIGNRTLM